MLGSVSPSRTVWTPKPAFARVVGFWPLLAPLEDFVDAGSVCLSVIFTSARIGSPVGLKSLYATVSDVQTALKVTILPHSKVRNGGAAFVPPPLEPAGGSI